MAKKKKIEYEVQDAADVPVDTVFVLNDAGEPVALEVPDDVDDDQA